jgi:hypothetical protein
MADKKQSATDDKRTISLNELMEALMDIMANEKPFEELLSNAPMLALVFPVVLKLVWDRATKEEESNGR